MQLIFSQKAEKSVADRSEVTPEPWEGRRSLIWGNLLLPILASIAHFAADAGETDSPYYIIRTVEKSSGPNPELVDSIEKKLKNIIIPAVEFEQTPLSDAIDFLQQKSVELDIDQRGFTISVSSSSVITPVNFRPADRKPCKIVPVQEKKITLNLRDISLGDALAETGKQAGLKYLIKSHALVFVSNSTKEIETVSYRYQITLPIFRKVLLTVPAGDFIEPALAQNGVSFTSGTQAKFNYRNLGLRVTNSADQIELIEDILEKVCNGRVITLEEAIRLGLFPDSTNSTRNPDIMRWIAIALLIIIYATWAGKRW